MPKIVAFVPMKLNNDRLPSKNTLPLAGIPMCEYVLKTLLKTENIDETYVYCSDEKIKEYIPNDIKYLRRGKHLDLSSTPILEVCQSFIKDVDADIYLLTHTTAPFLTRQSFEAGLNAVVKDCYDSAFAVKKLQAFMWQNGIPLNFSQDNVPRTQDLTPYYEETCGFYIWKREVMLDTGRRCGKSPYLVEVSDIEAIDINTRSDFEFADIVMRALKETI